MRPHQAVGYAMINSTAINTIVGASTASRITHGTRPMSSSLSSLPAINFYEVSGIRQFGIGTSTFSINCRATTPAVARSLAETVIELFNGTSGTGVYGTWNGFSIARASLRNDAGLIIEPDNLSYNAPVDIQIVYNLDGVS